MKTREILWVSEPSGAPDAGGCAGVRLVREPGGLVPAGWWQAM